MKKLLKFSCLLLFLLIGYIFSSTRTSACETIIYTPPTSSTINYGDHLYSSKLTNGIANVEGIFLWEKENLVLTPDDHYSTVIFLPSNPECSSKRINVNLTILPREIHPVFESELKKQYDETNNLVLPNYLIKGIIDEDTYIKGNLTAKTESVLVGDNIKVIMEGLEIAGDHKDYYTLNLNGYTATIHPKQIEKLGEIKNKITFNSSKAFVPTNSSLLISKSDSQISKEGYKTYSVYDIVVKSDGKEVTNIPGSFSLKLKIDDINIKKYQLFNYINNEYEKINYTITEDGYILYTVSNIGNLVIAKKEINITPLIIFLILVIAIIITILVQRNTKTKTKIKKYKSLKRRKSYENN